MLHVALWQPEIPPNTGNIARTCAATGVRLHLIGKLGFRLDDRHLARAGLDYWPSVDLHRHVTWDDFLKAYGTGTIWCVDNPADRLYTEAAIQDGDCLLFGSETQGVPLSLRERYANSAIALPMPTGKVRSLNLATSVGIVVYDALRRLQGW